MSLPIVQVPFTFLPAFDFLKHLRLVYFHRLLLRFKNSGKSFLRVIAVTSKGDLGFFDHNGTKKGTLALDEELDGVAFNNRCVFLKVPADLDEVEHENGVITLDFDTSSANVKGNETTDVSISRFIQICKFFSKVQVQRTGTIEQQKQQMAMEQQRNKLEPLVQGNDLYPQQQQQQSQPQLERKVTPTVTSPTAASTNASSTPRATNESLRRKSAGSTFQRLFSGFSWNGGAEGGDTPRNINSNNNNNARGRSYSDSTVLSGGNTNNNNNNNNNNNPPSSNRFDSSGGDDDDAYSPMSSKSKRDEYDTGAGVPVDKHASQRKKVSRQREEIFSRLGHRDGLDMKERLLDELARLEGSMKKQQALIEPPVFPTDDEELEQQRALAAIVMFICRRQSLMIDAKANILPAVRPKVVFSTASQVVENRVPVLSSYTDAFRSQFLG